VARPTASSLEHTLLAIDMANTHLRSFVYVSCLESWYFAVTYLESWFLVIIPTTPSLRSSSSICTTERGIGMGFGIIDIYISQPGN